jgi:hypothetical protein
MQALETLRHSHSKIQRLLDDLAKKADELDTLNMELGRIVQGMAKVKEIDYLQ